MPPTLVFGARNLAFRLVLLQLALGACVLGTIGTIGVTRFELCTIPDIRGFLGVVAIRVLWDTSFWEVRCTLSPPSSLSGAPPAQFLATLQDFSNNSIIYRSTDFDF